MVSYKRLNPEDVQFSSAVLLEEPRPVQEVPVSLYLFMKATPSAWKLMQIDLQMHKFVFGLKLFCRNWVLFHLTANVSVGFIETGFVSLRLVSVDSFSEWYLI